MANKIIVVTGDREGVGKTTLAINLATRLAYVRHMPVILIDASPSCSGETAQAAAVPVGGTAVQMLDLLASKEALLPVLRGRVPVNKAGVGVLNLAAQPREAERFAGPQWAFFLQGFSQYYDLVIDIETNDPLHTTAFDLADAVVWSLLPNVLSVRSTLQQLEVLQQQHKFSFEKFLFASNLSGLPQTLTDDMISEALERFDQTIAGTLPYEPEIQKLVNHGRSVVLDNSRLVYHQTVISLVDRITTMQRSARSNTYALPTAGGKSSSFAAQTSVAQDDMAAKLLGEKRTRWNQHKQQIHHDLIEEMNMRRIDLDTKGDPVREKQLRTQVENTVNTLIGKNKDLALTRDEREQLVKELVDEALGLGPLEELLRDPSITEIMVNRFDQVYVERKGKLTLSDKRFFDNTHVVQVIRRIIAPIGRRIDESVPLVDARLRDGSRVNAIIPPLAVNGPALTIRRFPERAFSSDDLVRMGSINQDMVSFLKICVLAKKNIVISGGTGTGKTTVLNMLSSFIPNDERIVTVEDTAELRMQQEHVVRLEARPPNIEGQGAISIRDLVKNCLRMRPDRIVVGECRGGEALDMLQAMNTGHDGSLTTIHANSPRDAFTRMETLCLMAGMDLPLWALREQIRSAVHLVVQLSRLQDGSRRITGITEVTGRTEDSILSQDLFHFVQERVDAEGKVHGHFEVTGQPPSFLNEIRSKGLQLDPAIFQKTAA